ncbi:hypothetical protein B7494_g2479 [Chlorociboria aeruginascens]|nr:hypothetical protein B7494_g2479 [Chlorociboria aeruginascens]
MALLTSPPENEKAAVQNPNPNLESLDGRVSPDDELGTEGVKEKALIRKLDWMLLPPLTLLYLLSFLDRSNIGNAKLDGLDTDLHITGNQYLLTLTIYFIGYEGLLTVVVAIGSYFFIHNYPSTAKFLTDPERALIQHRLTLDSDATYDEHFQWSNVRACFKDYRCWLYGLGFHTMSLPLYTLSLFFPTIIASLGYTAATAQLLTVPPYAFATILTIVVAIASERTHRRAPFVIASSSFAIIGYIILLAAPPSRPGVSYLGTFFAAGGIYPSCAIVLSWPTANVACQTKRATATALTITVGNLGAVLGTQLYRPDTSPRWFLGHGMAVAYLGCNIIVMLVLWACLNRENRIKRRRLESGEKAEGEIKNDADARWLFQT